VKKHMHVKTLALILATTTTLQLTGVTSQLLNGVSFITANATTGGSEYISESTTEVAIQVYYSSSGKTYEGKISATLPTSVQLESELPSSINVDIKNDGVEVYPSPGTTTAAVTIGTTNAAVTWTYNIDRTEAVGKVEIPQGLITLDGSEYSLLKPPSSPSVPITLEVNATIVGTGSETTTGPSVVKIVGREKVGKYLEAELLKADGTEFTTSAGVVYKWYRLDHRGDDISDGTLVENEKSYKLVGKDKGNYIKLVVTYNGNTFTDITGDIDRRSSSHSSSSNNDDDDNTKGNDKDNIPQPHLEKNENGFKIIENGHPVNGWKKMNGQWYLADSLGNVQTGWKQVNNVWYLLNNEGVMATGWQQEGGVWYLLNNDGGMLTGWQLVGGKWYLLHANGAMATGWQQSNGKWYYLYSDGSMANATMIDGYEVDMTGAWIR